MIFIIFLQVIINLFSKYNIENIKIEETGKKLVNINKESIIAPYFRFTDNTKITINNNHSRYYKGNIFIKKFNNRLYLYQKLELNDYVFNVLNSEIDDINKVPAEALKAFYLVIKNYSLTHLKRHKKINSDFCDIAHCQLYYGNYSKALLNLKNLKNKKIYYKNKITITPYSSSCGQYTCNSETIWNKFYPYLKGKKLSTNLGKWTYKLLKKDLIRITNIKNSINKFILKNGCVESIGDNNIILKGENFRRKINQELGWNKIKSNVFTIKEYKNYYLIKGSGFGHNIGFCIKEAIILAKEGLNYKEILKYFFKGVEIR